MSEDDVSVQFASCQLRLCGLECGGVEQADAAVGADDEGQGERVPALVGVGGVDGGGFERSPVAAVVGGDVGAVGADGDPGVCGGVVGDGGAIAVGRSEGFQEVVRHFAFMGYRAESCCAVPFIRLHVVPANHNVCTNVVVGTALSRGK